MTYTIEDYDWVYGLRGEDGDEYMLELELCGKELKARFTDNIHSGNKLEYVLSSNRYFEWCEGKRILPAEYLK